MRGTGTESGRAEEGGGDASNTARAAFGGFRLRSYSVLAFVLGFLAIALGSVFIGLTLRTTAFPVSVAALVFATAFVVAVSVAMVLLGLSLHREGLVSILGRGGPAPEGAPLTRRAEFVAPVLVALLLAMASAPLLLGSLSLSEGDLQFSVALVTLEALSIPLLVGWAVVAVHASRPRRATESERRRSGEITAREVPQRGLAAIPALTVLAALFAGIALAPVATPRMLIDGDFGDWASVPSHSVAPGSPRVEIEGLVVGYEFAEDGTYDISLALSDSSGNVASWEGVVDLPNEPPIPSLQATTENLTVAFDASASRDLDGSIVEWRWTFGDGLTASGVRVNHTYPWSGDFNASLVVEDDRGGTAATTSPVRVDGPSHPPFARARLRVVGLTVTADGSGSYDPDGQIANYTWAWGDGESGYGVGASHAYAAGGTFTVVLQVRDGTGLASNSSALAAVPNASPVPAFAYAITGPFVLFNATASEDPDGFIRSFSWSFGDGGTGQRPVLGHTYPAAGSYAVVLFVEDDRGASSSAVRVISIPPFAVTPPPVPAMNASVSGLLVAVHGEESYDPGGSSLSYFWAFGDGSTALGIRAEHLYEAPGTYGLSLKVVTADGRASFATRALALGSNVSDVEPPLPVVTVRISSRTAVFDASASTDSGGGVHATWSIYDRRPDLRLVDLRAVEDADQVFLYLRADGVPLTPPGQFRIWLSVAPSGGFARDGLSYEYRLGLAPGSPGRVTVLRYGGGPLGVDEWRAIATVVFATNGREWEVAIGRSLLLKPPQITVAVESVLAGQVFVSAPPIVLALGG